MEILLQKSRAMVTNASVRGDESSFLTAMAISEIATESGSFLITTFYDCARTTDCGRMAIPEPAATSEMAAPNSRKAPGKPGAQRRP